MSGKHLFKPGQSGNPAGRPRGARGKATAIIEALEKEMGRAETSAKIVEVFQAVVDQAVKGSETSQKMLLDRFAPVKLFEEGASGGKPIVNITINGIEPKVEVIEHEG